MGYFTFTIDILIRSLATIDRVQSFRAFGTFETFFMPSLKTCTCQTKSEGIKLVHQYKFKYTRHSREYTCKIDNVRITTKENVFTIGKAEKYSWLVVSAMDGVLTADESAD